MTIQGKLLLEGEAYTIINYTTEITQQCDYNGRPFSKPNWKIHDIVLRTNKRNDHFFEWAVTPLMTKHCEIIFSSADGISRSSTYKLFDVHCLFYNLEFDANNTSSILYRLKLSAATTFFNGVLMLTKPWAKTDPHVTTTKKITEEEEAALIDYYLTDETNKRLTSAEIGDTVYLTIQTKNLIGELLSIDLHNPNVDFKYEGKLVENDVLKNIQVQAAIQRIALEVLPESSDIETQQMVF
ncbi:hypothetical protein HN014_10900 [Aquimarina sp. TRL1]|uniref:type VI secretion system tube protein TssD n=1 Tax=Aquimarina sp. (strain TRL1) TaxID=2736252 RepID=UPI0015899AF0|nr:type VI secretion system tube protein TssD [Aquimarina sp. TRL1]QKX05401.1 hypothetical protein HN014_10900 [Aquimarina sp. TRL1]